MLVLADYYRSEFLATPQLIRIVTAYSADGPEPSILIKGSSILLKYIVQGARLRLIFSALGDHLLYAVEVSDEESKPAILWSILEREDEKTAINDLGGGASIPVFLFNELAVNVAWASASVDCKPGIQDLVEHSQAATVDHSELLDAASNLLDEYVAGTTSGTSVIVQDLPTDLRWHRITNTLITSWAARTEIYLFDADEGSQQEQLAVWLADNLQPQGVHHGPQIPSGKGTRELTDLLLSHQFGSILIESKTVSILGRTPLPNRAKLHGLISKSVGKGLKQLKGATRRLRDGTPVFSKHGQLLEVERQHPIHAIVLVPDFDLIDDPGEFGREFIVDFMKATGGFIHILDIAELLRLVQTAEMLEERGTTITRLMAFDARLIERARTAMEANTLIVEVLTRIE